MKAAITIQILKAISKHTESKKSVVNGFMADNQSIELLREYDFTIGKTDPDMANVRFQGVATIGIGWIYHSESLSVPNLLEVTEPW